MGIQEMDILRSNQRKKITEMNTHKHKYYR